VKNTIKKYFFPQRSKSIPERYYLFVTKAISKSLDWFFNIGLIEIKKHVIIK